MKPSSKTSDGNELKYTDVKIIRNGSQIVLPDEMTYEEAHIWLRRQEEAEEKKVSIIDQIPCYPLDGMVALMRAMSEVYGFADLAGATGMWGMIDPPRLIQVPTFDGKFETAAMSRLAIPKWEGGYLEPGLRGDCALVLTGEIKRKFEPEVKQIITLTRKFLAEQSIYKGTAITIDLSFMEEERPFHPINDAPKFMDIESVDESMLILNDVTDFELSANIFTLIEQTEACKRNRIPLKHGCLLMGPFGTGKTLTARVMAKKCVRNGWTFIYLKKAEQLANGLLLAQMYAPAVVFSEDIDQVMSGERDGDINELLNTIDGVDTKDKPIITILTTNRPEIIEPAFLRAGRIDTVIHMDAPDAKASIKFVHKFARDDQGVSLLVPNIELTTVGEELAGFVPAFIAEAVQKAKRFAIRREGVDITAKVQAEDLILAGRALKKHNDMVNRKHARTDLEIVASAVKTVHQWGTDGTVDRTNGNAVHVPVSAVNE